MIEMYMKNYDGFEGSGDIFSKMGLQVMDELTLVVSMRRFAEEIGTVEGIARPREGDLIYLPFNQAVWEIKFVEHEASFYQVGGLYFYEIRCHKFEYSSERVETGNPEIDEVVLPVTYDESANTLTNATKGDQNTVIEEAADDVLVFDETNPFGDP
jgi:hypothetical protein